MEMKISTIQISKGRAFEDIRYVFPQGFRGAGEPRTLKIETSREDKIVPVFLFDKTVSIIFRRINAGGKMLLVFRRAHSVYHF